MDKNAVDAAAENLRRAGDTIAAMNTSVSLSQFETAWSDFLTAAHRIFSKLEQGAKADGKSKAWFGQKVYDRRQENGQIRMNAGVVDLSDLRIEREDGKPVEVEIKPPHLQLRPVKDRGVLYAIPKSHLGKELKSQTPIEIAGLALKYLNTMVEDANQLALP
jgi:hypothetical protein